MIDYVRKNFKAMPSVVYLQPGVTKDFEDLYNSIIVHISLRFSLNITELTQRLGNRVHYWCTKFEGN